MTLRTRRAQLAGLQELAESDDAGDRITAGEGLAALAGTPAADLLLRRLLMDADDVGVTAHTAAALIEQADPDALRPIAWALPVADEQQEHWITAAAAYQDHESHALGVELAQTLLSDPDPQVRAGARLLSAWLATSD